MSRRPDSKEDGGGLQAKLSLLPEAPGVYLHKDAEGKVIYVGKALRLNNRVRSYFQSGERDPKTEQLVRRIRDFDYIVTASEQEALVLEDQLIKEYRPRYNIRLKDDKRYPYIRISWGEAFPRVEVVRRIAADGARYFGPYTNAGDMRETLNYALRIFQVRTCHLDLPHQTVPRACLDYQIGRCSAPCVGFDGQKSYRKRVRDLIRFLEGEDRRLLSALQAEITVLAREMEYEAAAAARDRLRLLERTLGGLSRIHGLKDSLDACALVRDGRQGCGVVLRIRRGRVLTTHHFLLEDRLESEASAFMAQLLREYYPRAGDMPATILLSHDLTDREHWEGWLGELRGGRVRLTRPRRGPRHDAVRMAVANATWKLNERNLRPDSSGRNVAPGDSLQLQAALDLKTVPETIECFDISNFQGKETVASLVYFRGGKPVKSRYRRFRIRTVDGIDDFASMNEVMGRYYSRLREKGQPPADLVVVDGGRGQISAAREALTELGLHDVELVGLAKRDEEIHREGDREPVRLPRTSPALKLLQRVRDEAHRFAITYHRLLREQKTTASVLDLIPGIGRMKKLALLHHFNSVDDIRRAGAAELGAVRGLNQADVGRIIEFFAGLDGGGNV